MRVDHRLCPLGITIPSAMDIVRHEVEIVDIFRQGLYIESLQVPCKKKKKVLATFQYQRVQILISYSRKWEESR